MEEHAMRLVTRSDFDGLVCGVLLKEAGIIDAMVFVHPKDVQDGKVPIDANDVLANVPFVPGCGMWFDHHSSEEERGLHQHETFAGACQAAQSAARVIYDHYGGRERFPRFAELIDAVDRYDSAMLTADDVFHPQRWILLAFIMDPRTGLGRYHDYRISNYQLMEELIDYCRTKSCDEILKVPDVAERVARYFEHEGLFRIFLQKHSAVHDNVVVTDLRGVPQTPCGNRFVIHVLYPDQNVAVRVFDGKANETCVISAGHDPFTRDAQVNVGSMMLAFGGGGHERAGTCQVPHDQADAVLAQVIEQCRETN
jgi:nanoRNase/pAp phosphatase (c-di-AMP/oligoRNAs hydrolase)